MRCIMRLTLIALALLLTACGGAVGGAPLAPTAQIVQRTPAPVPTGTIQSGTGAKEDILVTYHKSGGFAGLDETLTVYANGKLSLHSRVVGDKAAQVAPSDLSELRKLLSSPEFAGLQLPAPPVAPDQFVYELTVPGSAGPIVTVDGARNPPVLNQAIDELEKLRARVE